MKSMPQYFEFDAVSHCAFSLKFVFYAQEAHGFFLQFWRGALGPLRLGNYERKSGIFVPCIDLVNEVIISQHIWE